MKFSKILIWVLISVSSLVSAQDTPIRWSPDFEEESGDKMGNVLYDDGANVYLFVYNRSKGKKTMIPGIMKLDNSMKPVLRQDFTAAAGENEDMFLLNVFYCGGKFVMLTYGYNKSSNTKTVYATSIDVATLNTASDAVELWKIVGPERKDIDLGFVLSNDSNVFAVTASIEQKASDMKKIAHKVFDSKLASLSEKIATLSYKNEQYTMLDNLLSNTGDIYYFAKAYKGKPNKEVSRASNSKQANYTISVLLYKPDGTEKEKLFDMGTKLLDNIVAISEPKSTDVLMYCTFTNIDMKFLTGFESFRIDSKTGEVISQKAHTFSPKLIEQMKKQEEGFKTSKSGVDILKTFNVYDLKITDDGRVYFILENDFSITVSSKYGSSTTYYSRGILVTSLDIDGNAKWMNYIPKNQFFSNDIGYIYPFITTTSDNIKIYFNDTDKNLLYNTSLSKTPPKKFNEIDRMNLMLVDIDNEGKMTKKVVYKVSLNDFPIKTTMTIQGSGDRIIVYGWKLKKKINKIGVMTL